MVKASEKMQQAIAEKVIGGKIRTDFIVYGRERQQGRGKRQSGAKRRFFTYISPHLHFCVARALVDINKKTREGGSDTNRLALSRTRDLVMGAAKYESE